jgi:hypothetical protein
MSLQMYRNQIVEIEQSDLSPGAKYEAYSLTLKGIERLRAQSDLENCHCRAGELISSIREKMEDYPEGGLDDAVELFDWLANKNFYVYPT